MTITDQMVKAKATRTSNDGLRLGLTLLDSKYRDAVALIMSNRKDRTHCDINSDYVLHLFEQILVDSFQNPDYKPPQPDPGTFGDIDVEEKQQWDPNDPQIFGVPRSASWLLETWKIYIRRKYKSALDKWNKLTGGGNGQAWSFVDYCDKDARWLVCIFLQDVKANYLLASNAGGRMPSHLQMEFGFDGVQTQELSSLETTESVPTKRDALVAVQTENKKLKVKMETCIDKMDRWLTNITKHQDEFTNIMIAEVDRVNMRLCDTAAMQSMSPRTREKWRLYMEGRRKKLIGMLFDSDENEASGSDK